MFYWYSIFYVFFTIIIGQLIADKNIKAIFFAVMFLLYISCYNIYITFKYYIKLRNNPGIKGDRGGPGGPGQKGSGGVCSSNSQQSRCQACSTILGRRKMTTFRKLPTISPRSVMAVVKNQEVCSAMLKLSKRPKPTLLCRA